ncbi:MAG: hypothetical protein RR061_07980 [Muribaculaceae bacterium]
MISLKTLIEEKKITAQVIALIQFQLTDIMATRWEKNISSPILYTTNIMIDQNNKSISIIDCGKANDNENTNDIYQYGIILNEILNSQQINNNKLRTIANQCIAGNYNDVTTLQLALEKRLSNLIYIPLLIIIILLITILATFSN